MKKTATLLEGDGVENVGKEENELNEKNGNEKNGNEKNVNTEEHLNGADTEEEGEDPLKDLPESESDQLSKETLKHFNRYVDICKNRYKVVLGENSTHATNFQDVYSEWRVRNVQHRKYYGWDDPPPLPEPRKRNRPLNIHVQKRQEREYRRKTEGINVTKDGVILTDRELFELRRAQRLANAPKSIFRKIYEFFI